jgi:glutaredoxin
MRMKKSQATPRAFAKRIMKTLVIFLTPLLLFIILLSSSPAEIYQWKDSKGNVFFTDSPPAGVEVQERRYREERTERPQAKEETPRPGSGAKITPTTAKRAYSDVNVIMYMTSWCPYCRKAREFINSTGVSLTEYDIDKDKTKSREVSDKIGGKGVPVIDIEGIMIRGYVPGAIREAIERRRGL